jgi:NhaC family Na+:H+ antiporter
VAAVIVLGIRLQSGLEAVFLPLTLAVGVIGCLNFYLKRPWSGFRAGILDGVGKVSIACVILLLIGALVGLWILGGIIPTLIFYGLRIVSPAYFLPTTFLVCLVMSVVTGTAYGTIGTVGVALIGVAMGLGVSAPMAAGAILSGAYFGDKMSPLSDTTNIAAAMGEADLFRHIRSMVYTTLPAAVLTLIAFWVASGRGALASAGSLTQMLSGLSSGWRLSLVHTLPILMMLGMALLRVPTLLLLFSNVVIGALWAMAFQGASLARVFAAATTGFQSETGVRSIDQVLSRGGMTSMQAVIILVILAGALGGSLRATGVLETLVESMLRHVRRTGSLIVAVLASCYTVNLFTGNQALSLILTGQMFLPVFRRRGIDTTVMTRSLEDSGTLSAPLVPWGVAGGFCSQMLGVPTVDYFPYMWFAFIVPVFSIVFGYTGIAVWKAEEKD